MLKFFCYNYTEKKTTKQIIDSISKLVEATQKYKREQDMMLFVYVPALSLEAVCSHFEHKLVKISAQSFSVKPIIGEQTLDKLSDIHADMVISGMPERRLYLGETDESVATIIEEALIRGFKAFIGIGETEKLDDASSEKILDKQLRTACAKIPVDAYFRIGSIYRPVYENMDIETVKKRLFFLRKTAKEALPDFPIDLPLVYGGTIDENMVVDILKSELADGIFVDDNKLSEDEFIKIINKVLE